MLHFVTPGFRPHFISRQLNYLSEYNYKEFTWHIIMDNKVSLDLTTHSKYEELKSKIKQYDIVTTQPFGFEQRKYFSETLSINYDNNDWLYFLDDDNLPSYHVFECYEKYKNNNDINFVLMSQFRFYNPSKTLFGRKGHDKLGMVDIGNFLCKLNIIKGYKMRIDLYNYDGHLVEELKNKHGSTFAYEENMYSYYNILHV